MDHDEKHGISWGAVAAGAGVAGGAVLFAAFYPEQAVKALDSISSGVKVATDFLKSKINVTEAARKALEETYQHASVAYAEAVKAGGNTLDAAKTLLSAKENKELFKGSGLATMTAAAVAGTVAVAMASCGTLCGAIKYCTDGMSQNETLELLRKSESKTFAGKEDLRTDTAAIRGIMKARAAVFAQAGFPVEQMQAGQARA